VIVRGTGDQNYNPVVKQLKLKTKCSVYCCDCLWYRRSDNHNNKQKTWFWVSVFDYWVIILICCTTDNHNKDQNYNPVVKRLKLKTKSSVYCCDCPWYRSFEFQSFDYWVIILISCTTDNHNNKQKTWFWVSVVWLMGYNVYFRDCLWYRRSGL
jgi:hypothetical protein